MEAIAQSAIVVHRDPFILGRCNVVPDTFAGDFLLTLTEGQQDIQGQTTYCGGSG